MRIAIAILVTCLVLALPRAVRADEPFELDSKSSADIAAVDSTNYTAGQTVFVLGRPSIVISAQFSSAGATANIAIVRGFYAGTRFIAVGRTTALFTAGSTFTFSSRYLSSDVSYFTYRYSHVRIVLESISAGSVTISGSVQ